MYGNETIVKLNKTTEQELKKARRPILAGVRASLLNWLFYAGNAPYTVCVAIALAGLVAIILSLANGLK